MAPPLVETPQESEPRANAFGAQIAALRLGRGVTQRELARAVGFTPEHLSRVERGRRPPPRRAAVLRLAEAVGSDPSSLLSAAGYLPDPPTSPQAPRTPLPPVLADKATLSFQGGSSAALIAQLPGVIEGAHAFAQAALLLLRAAAERDPIANDTVSLSFSDATQSLIASTDTRNAWHATLRQMLGRGWRFRHLWQLHGSLSWPPQVIAELSALAAWPARYEPLYVDDADVPWSPRDLLVVPGIGALSGLTAGPGAAEAALVVRDPDQLRVLSEHVSRLMRRARPLLTTSLIGDRGAPGNDSRITFTEVLAGAHEEMGEHRLVKSGIPLRFVPSPSWWQMALHELPAASPGLSPAELAYRRRLWECRLRVRRVLEKEMRVSRHREICTTHGLRQFAEQGVVSSDDFLLDGLPTLSREERADALLQLLGQLNSNPNYELALVEKEKDKDKELEQLASVMWVVKGTRFFCLEAVHRADDDQRQDFMAVITEERLVTRFRDYFDSLWESLPERWRDKPRVEHWLDRQIELLH